MMPTINLNPGGLLVSFLLLCNALAVQAIAFPYGTQKIRGVSLGGWLLLEKWITPSVFEATGNSSIYDEWTYGEAYGSAGAAARLKSHWDTWITENDIATIKSYGLNHVRIPIGYWSINKNASEPFAVGAYPYLLKAVAWCEKYGLKVIVDLHGAPGSQNGFDNSGRRGPVAWHTSPVNVQRTHEAFKILVNDFVKSTRWRNTVTSIEALNEPGGFLGESVLSVYKQYSYDAYGAIRWPHGTAEQVDTLLSLSDAFQHPASYWNGFMPYNGGSGWTNVALDTHFYTVFTTEQLQWSNQQRINGVCAYAAQMTQSSLWVYAGEWSPAITDCAGSPSIIGAGGGAIYDGTIAGNPRIGSCVNMTGSGASFSPALKTFMRQYWETQANVFERGLGWIQWTWKTQNADEWSYSKGVEYGWIPRDPTQRMFGDLCATPLPKPPASTSTSTRVTTSTKATISTKTSAQTKTTTKAATTTTSRRLTTSKTSTSKTSITTTKKTSTTSKRSTSTTKASTTTKKTVSTTSQPAMVRTSTVALAKGRGTAVLVTLASRRGFPTQQ